MQLATRTPPSPPRLTRVELFRVLAEASRLKVLALCAEEELSVSELAMLLDDSQPQVSRKVAALREAGLVDARRDGTRTLVKAAAGLGNDPVVADALAEGRRLCLADGSLARIPAVVAAREAPGLVHFETPRAPATTSVPASPEHLAHLAALAPLLGGRQLAVDVGTGEGLSLDVLAPLFSRVIAVERSRAQLARVAERVAARGFHHVSLFPGSYDDVALVERVDAAGGADLVFAGRSLHHASRPAQAVAAFARLLKRGGFLVVLDYLPHDDDGLRSTAGDVWLGFAVDDVRRFATETGLLPVADVPIPAAFHPQGPDAKLSWHAWVAVKPKS
jgi:ArsR family transcriptional regulator